MQADAANYWHPVISLYQKSRALEHLDRHAQLWHSRYRMVLRAFKPHGLLKDIVTRRAHAKPDYVKRLSSHAKSGT